MIQRNIHADLDPYRHARPWSRYRVDDRLSERAEPHRLLEGFLTPFAIVDGDGLVATAWWTGVV